MLNNSINGDMMRGHIDTIILLSLINGDKHTNEIRDEIENKASGKYKVKQGTFYSALQRLSKQGFVSEYRSSTADSIRRKYFHLTEKGKKYVDENIDKWNYSKSVLDDLILDSPQETEEKIIVTPTQNAETEFEELLKNSDNIIDFEETTENNELDDYFKQLNSTLQTELNEITNIPQEEIKPIEEPVNENKDFFDNLLENTDVRDTNLNDIDTETSYLEETDELEEILEENHQEESQIIDYTDEIEENISILDEETEQIKEEFEQESTILDNTSVLDSNSEEVFSLEQELLEEIKENSQLENQDTQQIVQVAEENFEETFDNSQENILKEENNTENNEEIDTSYATDDKYLFGKDENKELYSNLLDTLFANVDTQQNATQPLQSEETYEPIINENIENEQLDFDFNNIINNDESEDVEETEQFEQEEQEEIIIDKVLDTKPSYSLSRDSYNSSYKVDYTDIINYARQEGFKVRTCYTTNKAEIGKVLLNKLIFHTSLMFFILAMIQLCVLFFVFKPSTIIHYNFYIITALLVFVFVMVNGIIYFTNKGRAVSKLSNFKNSLEIVFIICLNLILLICAYAIISNINFSLPKDLVRYIIIPILFVLNIPVYFIIKFLLLEKNTYYTK